jgi:hypothetical protein
VRYLADLPESGESVVYDGVLHLVDGRLSIGDADGEVTVNSLDDVTRVRVEVLDDWGGNAADVRVDLAPRA